MGLLVMPYMIPLFLGMTFDARHSRPGVSIFEDAQVDNPTIVQRKSLSSDYAVVTSRSDLLKNLDISGDLSLKIKSGMISFTGKGSYLTNNHDFKDSVILLTSFNYTAGARVLNSRAKPRKGWVDEFSREVLGTHYVSRIIYGIEMIASAKFTAHNSSELEDIKGDLHAVFGTKGKGIDLVADGKLDKIMEKISAQSTLEISYFGTLPIRNIPNSIEGLKELITTFEQQVEDAGLKDGIPMTVVLSPLTNIADEGDRQKFHYLQNEELMSDLTEFQDKFEELKSARAKLVAFSRNLPFDLDSKWRTEIGKLLKKIDDVLNVFHDVLWNLDVTKNEDQLNGAFEAYEVGRPNKYRHLVNRLINRIGKKVDRYAYESGDTYIHWGNDICPGEKDTYLVHTGTTIGSAEIGVGGIGHYICMGSIEDFKYGLIDREPSNDIPPLLAGVKYASIKGHSNPFKGPNAKHISGAGVPCAKCYSPDVSSITTFPGAESCPVSWELKYKGYLMSAKEGSHVTEYVCVDEIPTTPIDAAKYSRNVLSLTAIQSEGSLPGNEYVNGAFVKCVVCGLKSKNII